MMSLLYLHLCCVLQGNYDSYMQTRFELEENQMKRYKWEQDQIAHMKVIIANTIFQGFSQQFLEKAPDLTSKLGEIKGIEKKVTRVEIYP